MSYVVTIQRDPPISETELDSAVSALPEITLTRQEGVTVIELSGASTGRSESLRFEGGALQATTPSDDALAAMQTLAARLNATVIGEEGENLTNVKIASAPASGCGPVVATLILIGILLAVFWLFN